MVSYSLIITGSGNGWTYAVILAIEPLGTNFTENLIEKKKTCFYLPNFVNFI